MRKKKPARKNVDDLVKRQLNPLPRTKQIVLFETEE